MNKKHCEFLNEKIKCDLFDKIGQNYYVFQRQLENTGKVDKDVILGLIFDIELRKHSKSWLELVCKKEYPDFINFYEFLLKPDAMSCMEFYENDAWNAFLDLSNEYSNMPSIKKLKHMYTYNKLIISKDGKIKAEFIPKFAVCDSIIVDVI